MEVDAGEEEVRDSGALVVLPGETITRGSGFLRGHGTYVSRRGEGGAGGAAEEEDDEGPVEDEEMAEDGEGGAELVASVAGVVLRVNKLISVKPVLSRYHGDVGDVVVGRVIEVGNKHWRVDLGARQLGTLMLGSINLPGGALRRRTLEDQLQMHTLFAENDLVSAEVSSFYQHGGMAIHTRSMRYGKLQNGTLVTVPASLIKRMGQHFVSLPCGVDAVFGLNGRIWLTAARTGAAQDADGDAGEEGDGRVERERMTDEMEVANREHAERDIGLEARLAISRVRNAVLLLASQERLVFPQAVMDVYVRSESLGLAAKEMLSPGAAAQLSV